jgi:hypothetical protein
MSQSILDNVPIFVNIVFILTTFLCVFLFYLATNKSIVTLTLIVAWLIVQAILASSGFYLKTDTFPPKFMLAVIPAFLVIALTFLIKTGKKFISEIDLQKLTYLHTVRIPVELVLFWLCVSGKVPSLMTFEGRNFDILSGITAPIAAWYCFRNGQLKNKLLVAWNFICLALLLNIVFYAVLSAPFTFQKFAYEQPNVAVLFFPFVWLPSCIVPIVLFSHLVAIKRLTKGN